MLNAPAWLLANNYTNETVKGGGAIKGKNCTISNITKADGVTTVIYQWTLDNGTVKTDTMIINDGVDGVDGESAYEIAQRLGYSGTEEEWLASLVGATGAKGDKGVGIESITKQSTAGLVDTYLIMFADGTTTTFDVVNGANITKTSQLVNDSEFITNATIGLINYYLKDEVYSKAKIDELLRNIGAGLAVKIVPSLPTEEISGTTIYLINSSGSNYNQYMYIDGDWASLGSTSVDLSSYYNKTQIDTMLLGYITASTLLTQLMQYTKTADLAKVALSNDYNDLDNLPNIPDVSGIKPYASELQDSENTAPTSKVVYDEVQKLNSAIEEVKEDIPTDYLTEDDLEPYAKSETVGDLADLKTTEKSNLVGAVNEVNDSLVDKVDKNSPTFEHDVTIDGTLRVETAGYIADSKIATMDDLVDIESDLGELANVNRRQRRDITTNLSNLSTAIAEQNLEKYGYTIGDYFVGASGYKYHLADLDTYYGGYNSYGVVGTHHIGIVVDTGANTAWLSSGTVTSYNKSTLHALLTSTVLDKVKSDITALFGSWNNHLLAHQMLDNAVGGWGDTWVADTYIKAMSEVEIYGSTVFSADGFQTGIANKKLSIFNKYKYNEIFGNKNIWLKSLSSASAACAAAHAGNVYDSGVSDSNGAVGLILFY